MSDAAWSDAILAVVATYAGFRLLRQAGGGPTAGVGLALVGLAAVFGTIRFAGVEDLAPTHWGVTRLASLVGVPLVGVGYATEAFAPPGWAQPARRYSFVLLLVAAVALIAQPVWGQIVGGLGMLLVLASAAVRARQDLPRAAAGAGGAVGVLVSGLVIGGEGEWGGLSRTAWFHLAFAASSALLAVGLLQAPTEAPSDPPTTRAPR